MKKTRSNFDEVGKVDCTTFVEYVLFPLALFSRQVSKWYDRQCRLRTHGDVQSIRTSYRDGKIDIRKMPRLHFRLLHC